MEQRLSLITLGVNDLTRAKDFYENVVGWTPEPGPPEIAFFDLGGTVFSLYPLSDMGKELDVTIDNRTEPAAQRTAMAHNVRSKEDVDAIFADLNKKGATILKEPTEVFWGGYSGYFADPDGHLWEVAYNPFWTIGDDGRVSMKTETETD